MSHIGRFRATEADRQLAKAIGHPVRAEALAILNTRAASPNEIAKHLGLEVGNVSYHVTELARQGCVELVDTKQRRGATEHFYRGVAANYLSDEFWAELSSSVRSGITLSSLQALISAARDAIESGHFEGRKDRHVSVTSHDLDGRGWSEARDLYESTLARLLEICVESEERLATGAAGSAEAELRATFGLLAFESPGS